MINSTYFSKDTNLTTYTEQVAQEPVLARWEVARPSTGVTSVVVRDGQTIHETQKTLSTTVSTLPADIMTIGGISGTKQSFANAGLIPKAPSPNDMLTISGVTAPRQSFINAGILSADDGTDLTQESAGAASESALSTAQETGLGNEPSEDYDALYENEVDAINDAVQGIPDSALDSLTARAVGVAVGSLEMSSVLSAITQVTGDDPGIAQARFQQAASAYQAQADHFLEGVGVKDVQAFYAFAKAHHRGQLQEAVTKQIYGGDMSAYRVLAQRWNFKQSGYGSRG